MRIGRTTGLALVAGLAVAGCSASAPEGGGAREAHDITEPAPAAKEGDQDAIKVAMPRIAYVYNFSFELPPEAIAPVIQRHISACDRLGPARCRILDMRSDARNGKATGGSLKLVVEAGRARAFGASLGAAATAEGGRQSSSGIEAEDLSKQIVDTEARLRAKQALADRLMSLLKNRNGPVAELVAAERSVAAVQEEIDAAQSWLAEARGRVAMSTFELTYQADRATGEGFWEPLRESLRDIGVFFGRSLAMLIMLAATLLPWLVFGGGIFFAVRWLRRRFRRDGE